MPMHASFIFRTLSRAFSCVLLTSFALASSTVAADTSPTDNGVFTNRRMPYDTFDRMQQMHITVTGGDLAVAFAPGAFAVGKERLQKWIKHSAEVVAGYYGRFPVETARILVVPTAGRGVRSGVSFGFRGAATKVFVGTDVTDTELKDDWILIHEMIHFAFPDMAEQYSWLREGQATYIESIARVQAGDLEAREVWEEFMQEMPKGLPQPGDQGLDRTHTWGRTYWGGALFCLTVDIEIRKRTHSKLGLQDALRAVVRAGGVNTESWPVEKALAVADHAVGSDVMQQAYARLKDSPGDTNLPKLWKQLGIENSAAGLRFNDSAPLAGERRAIMMPEVKDDSRARMAGLEK